MRWIKNSPKHFITRFGAPSEDLSQPKSRTSAVDRAVEQLRRLPPVPAKINLYGVWDGKTFSGLARYLNADAPLHSDADGQLRYSPWEDLQTVSKFDTVTIKLALVVCSAHEGRHDISYTKCNASASAKRTPYPNLTTISESTQTSRAPIFPGQRSSATFKSSGSKIILGSPIVSE